MPEEILTKAPNDGLGGETDEEKMGVTYFQIEEMIEKGYTGEERAKEKILGMHTKSAHKRNKIPVYEIDRKNYLEKTI